MFQNPWIKEQMHGTSVTVVLIGAETSTRRWVEFEIQESYSRGNGLLGIYIHRIRNQHGFVDYPGRNPFDNLWLEYADGRRTYLSSIYKTYDWVSDNGTKHRLLDRTSSKKS